MWQCGVQTHTCTYVSMYTTVHTCVPRKSKHKLLPVPQRSLLLRANLKLDVMTLLLATLAQSLCVSLPARLSVRLGSFQLIRGLQDTPTDDDDIRALVVEDFLWSGILLAQHISC